MSTRRILSKLLPAVMGSAMFSAALIGSAGTISAVHAEEAGAVPDVVCYTPASQDEFRVAADLASSDEQRCSPDMGAAGAAEQAGTANWSESAPTVSAPEHD